MESVIWEGRRSISGNVSIIAARSQATSLSVLPRAKCCSVPSLLLSLVHHHRHYCTMDSASVVLSEGLDLSNAKNYVKIE
jgi:hypothetical protein